MNKVIIIGSDHTNTLGVIRSFGENNINPYLIALSDTKLMGITKSKYLKKYWICKDNNMVLLTLISEFSNENVKPLVIATSDSMVALLDLNYNKLKDKFIIPNINKMQGEIVKYMDKYQQFLLAQHYKINTAKTIRVNLNKNDYEQNFDIFPCIIKPLSSFKGNKNDIVICDNKENLKNELEHFKIKNYDSVLVQELLHFDYECDMTGFVYNQEFSITGYVHKERIWPLKRGSFTFGKIEKLKNFNEDIEKIKKLLANLKYFGMFDIEFYICDDKLYLGEINFRNSSSTYLYGKRYICYYWFLSCINNKCVPSPEIQKDYYVMDEQAEIHNVIDHNITIRQYLNELKAAEILLTNNKLDKRPSKMLFIIKILNNLNLMPLIKTIEKACHKDNEYYHLKLLGKNYKDINLSNKYQWLEINRKNYELISNNEAEKKVFKKELNSSKVFAIALIDKNNIVGRALIKTKGSEDRFIKIKNDNSYLITNVYVQENYRGHNYQCLIIQELINRYVKNINKSTINAIVYTWNLPSLKNFQKMGFNIEKTHTNIRILKHSINKLKI